MTSQPEKHEITNSSNNEIFIKGTYNGISILIRESDRYVNATKMCQLISKKEYYRINDNGGWKVFCGEIQASLKIEELTYKLNKGYIDEIKGTYVHPKLVNYIAMWASPRYAVAVSEIMDSISARSQATGETFEAIKDETIKRQREVIAEAREIIEKQDDVIHNESVRSDNSNKKLYITKADDGLKLCANSTRKPKDIVKMFIFPSSMHIRREVIDKFKIKEFTFSEEILDDVIAFIEAKNPK